MKKTSIKLQVGRSFETSTKINSAKQTIYFENCKKFNWNKTYSKTYSNSAFKNQNKNYLKSFKPRIFFLKKWGSTKFNLATKKKTWKKLKFRTKIFFLSCVSITVSVQLINQSINLCTIIFIHVLCSIHFLSLFQHFLHSFVRFFPMQIKGVKFLQGQGYGSLTVIIY